VSFWYWLKNLIYFLQLLHLNSSSVLPFEQHQQEKGIAAVSVNERHTVRERDRGRRSFGYRDKSEGFVSEFLLLDFFNC